MTLPQSKILIVLMLSLVVFATKCSAQSRKDIKEARVIYQSNTGALRGIDSLYYEGIKATRHDKHNIFLRIKMLFTTKPKATNSDTHGDYTVINGIKYYKPSKFNW